MKLRPIWNLVEFLKNKNKCYSTRREALLSRSTRRGGGVGVLFKNTLRLESAKMWHAESFECVEVVLFGSSVASAVRLFVLYRPPSSGRLSKPFALFLQEFGDLIIYARPVRRGGGVRWVRTNPPLSLDVN